MLGKIVFIRPVVRNGRLRVRAIVKLEGAGYREAFLPERELAALVSRSLLVFNETDAPFSMLEIISSMLRRMTVGRLVGLVERCGGCYITFLSWRDVRFRKALRERKTTSA